MEDYSPVASNPKRIKARELPGEVFSMKLRVEGIVSKKFKKQGKFLLLEFGDFTGGPKKVVAVAYCDHWEYFSSERRKTCEFLKV